MERIHVLASAVLFLLSLLPLTVVGVPPVKKPYIVLSLLTGFLVALLVESTIAPIRGFKEISSVFLLVLSILYVLWVLPSLRQVNIIDLLARSEGFGILFSAIMILVGWLVNVIRSS